MKIKTEFKIVFQCTKWEESALRIHRAFWQLGLSCDKQIMDGYYYYIKDNEICVSKKYPCGYFLMEDYNFSKIVWGKTQFATGIINKTKKIKIPIINNKLHCRCLYNLKELIIPENSNNIIVDCSQNKLTNLIIPEGVIELDCSINKLTNIIIPNSLKVLNCKNNLINNIELSENIIELNINNNVLTNLIIPKSLKKLDCRLNRITNTSLFPELPDFKISHQKIYESCDNDRIIDDYFRKERNIEIENRIQMRTLRELEGLFIKKTTSPPKSKNNIAPYGSINSLDITSFDIVKGRGIDF